MAIRRKMRPTGARYDCEAFAARDGLIGHGRIVVFDDTVDMAARTRFAMGFAPRD